MYFGFCFRIIPFNVKSKFFKNPDNYFWLMLAMSLGHVLFMRFFFQEEWADSPGVVDFIKKMTAIVPMIGHLEKFQGYKNYWGVFYSALWIISPVFLICGYMSAYFANKKSLDFIRNYSIYKYLLFFLFFLISVAFVFCIPEAGTKFWFNELSTNLLVIAFTCFEISGVIFLLGRAAGAIQIKLTEKYSDKKE